MIPNALARSLAYQAGLRTMVRNPDIASFSANQVEKITNAAADELYRLEYAPPTAPLWQWLFVLTLGGLIGALLVTLFL
jgi:hypothetical protein